MIRAMLFDLDSTLVQTERLKALSYAHAVVELCPHNLTEAELVEAFKEVVRGCIQKSFLMSAGLWTIQTRSSL
ncbi:MAG: hypothetical protein JSW12_17975 [Deltaproteobacteria bacterium]|nr:MAG: hypothetical protein JSW12_17975 [Deltaproteobacteria bacterium]